MSKYIMFILLGLIAFQNQSFGQKKKYCVVYYDQTKANTDSSFSKSVVSNVVKVREGDLMKVKQEFNKEWALNFGSSAIDTTLLEVLWHDSKPEAKRKQKELIDSINRNPNAKLFIFSFEFEYEFGFEIGSRN